MIVIRKVRNVESYCIKDKAFPYISVFVPSKQQAERVKLLWEMETHADEIKSDIFEPKGSAPYQRAPPLENPDRKRNC